MPFNSSQSAISTVLNDHETRRNNSSLWYAVNYGNLHEVNAILNKGNVNVNAVFQQDVTLLSRAIAQGYTTIALALINAGAVIDRALFPYQITALHEAAVSGNVFIAKKLLEAGANIHLEDGCGSNALDKASVHRMKSMIELLLKHGAKHSNYYLASHRPVVFGF